MAVEITDLTATETAIAGLWHVTPKAVADERGTVREFFRASAFAAVGLPVPERWTQINLTSTRRGSVRGLHGERATKLVGLAAGRALGAYLDARRSSATYGLVAVLPLEVGTQVLIPAGVCNGFQATGEQGCEYLYCFDVEWQPGMAGVSVRPTDPALGIDWPLPIDATDPCSISAKDAAAPLFADL